MPPAAKWFHDHPRVGGAVILLLCAILAKFDILDVLAQAEAGKSISYYRAPWFMLPMLCGFALIALAAPDRVRAHLSERLASDARGEKPKAKPAAIALSVVLLIPGLGLGWWMMSRLTALGY
jgi:hypothetical protein